MFLQYSTNNLSYHIRLFEQEWKETVLQPGISKAYGITDSKRNTRQRQTDRQSLASVLWHNMGPDCHLRSKDYLVVIDYHSTLPKMALLANISSSCIITHITSNFARQKMANICSAVWLILSMWSQGHMKHSQKTSRGKSFSTTKETADSAFDPYLASLSQRACSPCSLSTDHQVPTALKSNSDREHRPPYLCRWGDCLQQDDFQLQVTLGKDGVEADFPYNFHQHASPRWWRRGGSPCPPLNDIVSLHNLEVASSSHVSSELRSHSRVKHERSCWPDASIASSHGAVIPDWNTLGCILQMTSGPAWHKMLLSTGQCSCHSG